MSTGIAGNLLDPVILFFLLGLLAGGVRSNLEIPPAVSKLFSLYLLMAIGFKGGTSLAESGLTATAALALVAAVLMATVVPVYSFLILRRRVDAYDAAAMAATYGSVSAVTFVAAQAFLMQQDVPSGGYMTVAMVLMEVPAILMAVVLASFVRNREAATLRLSPSVGAAAVVSEPTPMGEVLREAFTNGAQLLLLGSLVIGLLAGEGGRQVMAPFTSDLFKGILAFFLLEMGLVVARQLRESRRHLNTFLIGFALVMPVVNATVAMLLGRLLGLGQGDALLLAVLAASASYIVVPAVVRDAIPEAAPGGYFTMALGISFPFNIVVGIPLYFAMVDRLWG